MELCPFLLRKPLLTIKDLTHAISHLASIAIAVLPSPLVIEPMQHEQMLEFSMERDYK